MYEDFRIESYHETRTITGAVTTVQVGGLFVMRHASLDELIPATTTEAACLLQPVVSAGDYLTRFWERQALSSNGQSGNALGLMSLEEPQQVGEHVSARIVFQVAIDSTNSGLLTGNLDKDTAVGTRVEFNAGKLDTTTTQGIGVLQEKRPSLVDPGSVEQTLVFVFGPNQVATV